MLLAKRENINEVFTYKSNFSGEKNISVSERKNDNVNTEKNYTAVLGIALALSAFMDRQKKEK